VIIYKSPTTQDKKLPLTSTLLSIKKIKKTNVLDGLASTVHFVTYHGKYNSPKVSTVSYIHAKNKIFP